MSLQKRLPARVEERVLGFLQPPELLLLAPLVCRAWRATVRKHASRAVLLNLRLVVGGGGDDVADLASSGDAPHPSVAGVRIQRPAPLDAFCRIPAGSRMQAARDGVEEGSTGSGAVAAVAGEGVVVTCRFDQLPTTADAVRGFLGAVASVLHSWLPRGKTLPDDGDEDDGTAAAAAVRVVPWEVQVSGARGLREPAELHALSALLAHLEPVVFKAALPPRILLYLLPDSVQVLHLSCSRADDPVDFSALRALASADSANDSTTGQSTNIARPCNRPPFGSGLVKLVLDSPLELDVGDDRGSVEPEELEDLRYLKSLKDLTVGGFYPITSYAGFLPVLQNLRSLTRLSIKGLDQGEIPPSDLVHVLLSLPHLEVLHDLCNVDSEFWAALLTALSPPSSSPAGPTAVSPPPPPPLRDLALSWDAPTPVLVRVALVGALRCFAASLRSLRLDLSAVAAAAPGDDLASRMRALVVADAPQLTEDNPGPAATADPAHASDAAATDTSGTVVSSRDVLFEFARLAAAQNAGLLPVTRLRTVGVVTGGAPPLSLEDVALLGRLNLAATDRGTPTLKFSTN